MCRSSLKANIPEMLRRLKWVVSPTLGARIVAAIASFQLLAVSAALPGEVDRFCRKSFVQEPKTGRTEDVCAILAVERGGVTYIEPGFRRLVIGKYISAGQRFVPRTEAPIRDLRSPGGWHIVVSSFLQRAEFSASLRVRFFGPDGKLRGTGDVLMALERIEVGHLFGGTEEILAIQSNEEHSYNSMSGMWLLPQRGEPRQLIDINATLGKFSRGGNKLPPGAWIRRQTYDGVHAETKGWVNEFWVWDPARKSLTPERNSGHN
jgi:hypothetical protein